MNISKLYDLIWAKADRLIKQYNPCDIQDMYGISTVCNNICMVKQNGSNLCCQNCKWLDDEIGCTVKSVGCKVGTCWSDENWYSIFDTDLSHIDIPDIFIIQMDRLRDIAKRYKLYYPRKSKTETFNRRN